MKNNYKKLLIVILSIIGVFALSFSSYSIYKKMASNNAEIPVAKFQILLNSSEATSQNISLSDTITTNDYSDSLIVPGTNGAFDLELDFSNVDVSVSYTINFDTSNIPTNLKLYSDSSYENEIVSINDSYLVGSNNTKTHTIYWKWLYLTDDSSNEDDNLYMDQDIAIPTTVVLSQIVGGGN